MNNVRARKPVFLLAATVLLAIYFVHPAGAKIEDQTVYYGIEIGGTLCGYTELNVSSMEADGREMELIQQRMFILLSALGSDFNSDVHVTFHVDPETGQYTYMELHVKQGDLDVDATVRVDGDTLRSTSSLWGDANVPMGPDVVLESPFRSPGLIKEFVELGKTEISYRTFDIQSNTLQTTVLTKTGTEKIKLAGKSYEALVVDQVYPSSGLKIKSWIDMRTGLSLKTIPIANRVVYLAKPSVIKKIKTASLDELILTSAGKSIADVSGIRYLKVEADIEPVGLAITPESLNVPGQSFEGTAVDNQVRGVFEIAHPRYDGSNSPPFPADYSRDEALRKYTEPSLLVESNNPVLVAEARRITEGSKDSWEAAIRLSTWVGENIGYAIPGGGSARKTYDIRAGECGAHSLLLASFCRAVGIPARVVWGCMYVPNGGGSFGQHGWNEIYMGEAGWIPVDATAMEFDYADSGHIRFGEMTGAQVHFNPHKMRILDYRVEGGESGDTAAASLEEKYGAFLGNYEGDARHAKMEVLVKDGSLTLDIKGRLVLAFNEPDERGRWVCKMAPHVYLTFDRDDGGRVTGMKIHEVLRMPRQADAGETADDVPPDLRPLLGTYHLPQLNADFEVKIWHGRLALYDPFEKKNVRLEAPDESGWRMDEFGKNSIYFETDDAGNATALKIDSSNSSKRK